MANTGPEAANPGEPNPLRDGLAKAGYRSLEAELDREPNRVKRFLKMLGPGLITGASDDDPSGIGTYAVAGAQLGYTPLWTAPLTLPFSRSCRDSRYSRPISASVSLKGKKWTGAPLRLPAIVMPPMRCSIWDHGIA